MSRPRKKQYHDVYLHTKDIKKLKKGYTVSKRVNGSYIALHTRDRATQRRIEQLQSRIRELMKG